MEQAALVENSDHRVCEDLRQFAQSVPRIVVQICVFLVLAVWQTIVVSAKLDQRAVVISWIYLILGLLLAWIFARILAKLTYEMESREGDFRFQHALQRDRAGDIRMLQGSKFELRRAKAIFSDVYQICLKVVNYDFCLYIVVQFFAYLGTLVNIASLAISLKYLKAAGAMPPPDLLLTAVVSQKMYTTGSATFVMYGATKVPDAWDAAFLIYYTYTSWKLLKSFSSFIALSKDYSLASGLSSRLCELKTKLETKQPPPDLKTQTLFMTAEHLTIGYDEPLLCGISYKFTEGKSVLFTGASGVGKTTLLRVLCGHLAPLSGMMHHSHPGNMDFYIVTEHPYFPKSSIWELLHYPEVAPPLTAEESSKTQRLLQSLDLKWSPSHVEDWLSVISPGEAQRLACLRAYWNKPRICFIDEGTSNVDEDMETMMYRLWLAGDGTTKPTIISFGSRTSLVQFHDHHIHLK
eukprot:GEMP01014687.1.p1 GENE.GEMP01014687.1~~GEMP01014687.1.p1  ORF type:complete len:496 (+),score=50.05 GEMP01014687.1:99-1490(+)